ncbi:oxidoreductase [Aestuariirhabdus sp. Z084]|uniref:acrylyl-CoA reductase (NADPH) n=1 Tax=Aestuariirhabdus haliotis TaxID=2918751 RepID=UPI00201B3D8E|nr:MDR family oxidoreductase [Aestuariirhabdus haliotis]MCL6414248.1 oxidoreductase [Aestuariirhabdus haliotis]MCL6418180.1 oxidoreductase [Aestuariirhabdus haliotis]
MSPTPFKALVLTQQEGNTRAKVERLNPTDLPEEEVLLEVEYSSLNYKDALAITGTGKIVRQWPMVPGIDLAGTVVESGNPEYAPGNQVVLTGWGVGEQFWGGYSQQQRVKAEWLVPLPNGITPRQSMTIGTAGLTAMLCVMALEDAGLTPESGTIVVSGAAGGVGSVAIAILAKLGFKVAAITGRESTHDYLRALGASELLSREEMAAAPRALEKQRWAGGIDTVGDTILARIIAETDYNGAVAACGLAAGFALPTTVMPFILRNVRLQGVDSVMCPLGRRHQAWARLAKDLPMDLLGDMEQEVGLEALPGLAEQMIKGQVRGRTLVNLKL